jgi:hypothetical protein
VSTASRTLTLPGFGSHTVRDAKIWPATSTPSSRIAYAAAHVVADPLAANGAGAPAAIDWDATLAFRRHLWSLGLRVADATDAAQRDAGLDWYACAELIQRTAAEAREFGDPLHLVSFGAGTDHRPDAENLPDVVEGYLQQIKVIRDSGAGVIMMASRQLARLAQNADDYLTVYDRVLGQVDRPVVLHWLGEAFDPDLAGYWGSHDVAEATKTFLGLIDGHATKIDGVKVSLLDKEHEIGLRAALPSGVKLYTGDDLNYPELIETGSHALLGVFDAIAPAAANALAALDKGDIDTYYDILEPTVALSRTLFEKPVHHYRTGVVFLAWLAGHQANFTMVDGAQSARSIVHLGKVFRLADKAGLLPDPELAVARMRALVKVHGA